MAYRPSHAIGNYAIEIDGQAAGWVKNVGFPEMKLAKVESKVGSLVHTAKAGGQYEHTGFEASYSVSEMGKARDWMMSLVRKEVITADGAIIQANHNFEAVRRVDWTVGNITSFKLPKLAAAEGKNPFMIDFKWEAETIEWTKASGKITAEQGKKHKQWGTNNFTVDGLVGETQWIQEVELPEITAKLSKESYGSQRLQALHYANIDSGDIKFKISGRSLDSHLDYIKKVIKDGKLTSDEYLTLTVTLMDHSLTKPLGDIVLKGCGLTSFALDKPESNADKMASFTLTYSVEEFELEIKEIDK